MPHFATLNTSHTGQLRPHHHTTYMPLILVMVVVGIILTTCTTVAWTRPGPSSGYIGLTGAVAGKPPTVAAKITTPTAGQRFSESPVTVSGTCPKDTLVEIFKNDIFAGSTVCSAEGTFSFKIDLLFGANELTARVYDALNQPGPVSNTVSVFYDALPSQAAPLSSLSFGGPQLILNTDAVFRGTFPNQPLSIPIEIIGGRANYALNIQWGDNTNKVIPRGDNTPFRTSHVYTEAGTYTISIQATDADERVAFLTVAAIVNGQPTASAATDPVNTQTSSFAIKTLFALWPIYMAVATAVVSFWAGERREKRLLAEHGLLLRHA